MPSKKPIIQAVTEESYYIKFQELCRRTDRSQSKLAGMIIKEYIDNYEKINGELK